MQYTIKELIQQADEYIEDFTNEDGSIDEERKKTIAYYISRDIGEGNIGCVEGIVLLALIDGMGQSEVFEDQTYVNRTSYPEWEKVRKATDRRIDIVPSACHLASFLADDFLNSYCKRSISFEELVARLVMLDYVPYPDYLRMSPKERRALGTNVPLQKVIYAEVEYE